MTSALIIGIDFSARSDRALRRGILLARQHGYHLHLVHVRDGVHAAGTRAAELLSHLRDTATQVDGVSCESEVREGDVAEQIRIVAEEMSGELILTGRRRPASIADRLRQSSAESIYRQSSVPLLVVGGVPAGPYERVLVPTELSDEARLGISLALALPVLKHCNVAFFHAYDPAAREMLGRAMVERPELDAYLAAESERAHADLEHFADTIGRRDSPLLVESSSGKIASDIHRAARTVKADLIVMTVQNKGAVYEALVGNTTAAVLKTNQHDVMIA